MRLDGWKTAWKDIFSMLENQTETIEDDINKKSEKKVITVSIFLLSVPRIVNDFLFLTLLVERIRKFNKNQLKV